jgi:hypothetical protein
MSSALQQQREHYKAVRARLTAPRLIAPTMLAKPLAVVVYPIPVGPNRISFWAISSEVLPTIQGRKSWRQIANEVCAKHGLDFQDVLTPSRVTQMVRCRWEIMYRLHHETTLTLTGIASKLGDMDHSTIMNGIRRHEQRMREAGQ